MHCKYKEQQQRNHVTVIHSNAVIGYLVINIDALKLFVP